MPRALTIAPWRPAVESGGDDRLLSAATMRLIKHDVARRSLLLRRWSAGRGRPSRRRRGPPRLTSATSRGCGSPAPNTTLLVLVRAGYVLQHITALDEEEV
jgi:hypothetical protein